MSLVKYLSHGKYIFLFHIIINCFYDCDNDIDDYDDTDNAGDAGFKLYFTELLRELQVK